MRILKYHEIFSIVLPSLKIMEVKSMVEAYCMKCRSKCEMKDPKRITMKNGKPATQGACPTCNTKLFKIGGK